jgi:hypothetical protein
MYMNSGFERSVVFFDQKMLMDVIRFFYQLYDNRVFILMYAVSSSTLGEVWAKTS